MVEPSTDRSVTIVVTPLTGPRFADELGYTPQVPFEQGLKSTVQVVSRQRSVVATAEESAIVKLTELSIPGLFVLESPVHGDERGSFVSGSSLGLSRRGVDLPGTTSQLLLVVTRRRARAPLLDGPRRPGERSSPAYR